MNNVEKVLNKINAYLTLVRYRYTNLEKLSRLHILNDYYQSKEKLSTQEKVKSKLSFADQLEDKFILPLKVHGYFLSEGRPKRKYYSAKELEKSVKNPLNHGFPFMLDHKDDEVGKIIGRVDRIEYDAEKRALKWFGHINDETNARNVLDGIISQVSATIYSTNFYDNENGLSGKDLVFKELSAVMKGADPINSIQVG